MTDGAAPRVVLVVSAASGAGKTTLLERLIAALTARGLRVGAVKRTHHDVELDPPGKDSRRLRDAGASPVLLSGPRGVVVFGAPSAGSETETIERCVRAAAAFGPLDLVLVEGGRAVPSLPRIEVVAPGGSVVSAPETLLAVASDAPVAVPGVRCVRRDDVDALAEVVVAYLGG